MTESLRNNALDYLLCDALDYSIVPKLPMLLSTGIINLHS